VTPAATEEHGKSLRNRAGLPVRIDSDFQGNFFLRAANFRKKIEPENPDSSNTQIAKENHHEKKSCFSIGPF